MNCLVSLKDVKKYFLLRRKTFGGEGWIRAVDGVSFEIRKGDVLGLVGESGSGKSTLSKIIIGLIPATGGNIELEGRNVFGLREKEKRVYLRRMSIVFQDPFSSLDPRMTVSDLLREPLGKNIQRGFKELAIESLERVGLRGEYLFRYPHEFSGGQRQRIAIARALIHKPSFVILDEPTSSLDVSVQAQILNLLIDLKTRLDFTYLFISHNIGVIRYISSRVAVMYRGRIVEIAATQEIFDQPLHPYTARLLAAVPQMNRERESERGCEDIKEFKEHPTNTGCVYYERCGRRKDECFATIPKWAEVKEGHFVCCLQYDQQ